MVLPKYIFIPKIMYIKKISPACLELQFPVVKCMSQMEYSVKTLATNDKIEVFLLVYCRYCETQSDKTFKQLLVVKGYRPINSIRAFVSFVVLVLTEVQCLYRINGVCVHRNLVSSSSLSPHSVVLHTADF